MTKLSKDYSSIPSIAADVEHGSENHRSATSIYHSSFRTLIWATAAVVGLTLLICSMAHDCGIWQSSQTNMPMNETHSYATEMEGQAKYDDSEMYETNPVPVGRGGPPSPFPPKRFSEASHSHNSDKKDKPHHHHRHHHHHYSKQSSKSEDEPSESDDQEGWMSSLHAWWNNMADKVDEKVHEKQDDSNDKQDSDNKEDENSKDEEEEDDSDDMKMGNMTEAEESVVVVKHASNDQPNMTTDDNGDN